MEKFFAVFCACLFVALNTPAQTGAGETVEISGDVAHPLSLTREAIAKRPHITVTIPEHGNNVSYEGVLLDDLLKEAGAPSGSSLKGKAMADYVLAEASDGYKVVYALAELDPAFTDKQVILADSSGGKPLSATQGPFRLVVSGEKKPARSIRMLTKISVVQLAK
jgi:hypothetical protein